MAAPCQHGKPWPQFERDPEGGPTNACWVCECARLREELAGWKDSNRCLADSVAHEQARSAELKASLAEVLDALARHCLSPSEATDSARECCQLKFLALARLRPPTESEGGKP